ncbi:hypothetical protein HanRHA438_Chr04g0158561 [Helianthus annuus]|nr:hypothetical protein HanRHA438_Chr04g0158561 [Helianthus annuus]
MFRHVIELGSITSDGAHHSPHLKEKEAWREGEGSMECLGRNLQRVVTTTRGQIRSGSACRGCGVGYDTRPKPSEGPNLFNFV